MAKNEQDSLESANALTNDTASEATPYINDDAQTSGRFAWFKSKSAKITAISVGGALAIGAVFAGGAVAGQVASHNGGPSIGAPFEKGEHGGPGAFGNSGQPGDQLGGQPGDAGQLGNDDGQLGQGDDSQLGDDQQGDDVDHQGQFGGHGPRPPHDFEGEGDDDGPRLGGLNGSTGTTPTAPQVQSN